MGSICKICLNYSHVTIQLYSTEWPSIWWVNTRWPPFLHKDIFSTDSPIATLVGTYPSLFKWVPPPRGYFFQTKQKANVCHHWCKSKAGNNLKGKGHPFLWQKQVGIKYYIFPKFQILDRFFLYCILLHRLHNFMLQTVNDELQRLGDLYDFATKSIQK